MAIKRIDIKEDLQEVLDALQESSEGGHVVFWTDQSGETTFIKCSDGDQGSISSAEFGEIKGQIGKQCLVCNEPLELIFDSESKPVLSLSCDRCETIHRVVSGELCLTDC